MISLEDQCVPTPQTPAPYLRHPPPHHSNTSGAKFQVLQNEEWKKCESSSTLEIREGDNDL